MIALRPTLLPAAPRVLNKILDTIVGAVGKLPEGNIKRRIFETGLNTKLKNLKETGQLTHMFYDRVIFNKIKDSLGLSHLRVLISGKLSKGIRIMYM